jgi:cold shock CspA family protein
MRTSGTVKFFNVAKGFGFISPEDASKGVFVHATALEAWQAKALDGCPYPQDGGHCVVTTCC